MEIRVLGPLEVWDGGRRIELGGGRQRRLLAILTLHANEVVSTDRLIDALWDGRPPPTAQKALQNLVVQLRRTIDPQRGGVLVTRPPGYLLHLDADAIDAGRFERLAVEGRQLLEDHPEQAAARLAEALSLWRGDALADFAYERFAQNETARLEELKLIALEDRIDADLAIGRAGELVPEIQGVGLGFSGKLLRIDARDGATSEIPVGTRPSDPAIGFSSVWAAMIDEGTLWRVDAVSVEPRAIIDVGRAPFGVATGASSVWVANNCDGTVSRIDPDVDEVVATIETGCFPKWLAVAGGHAWIGVSGQPFDAAVCH